MAVGPKQVTFAKPKNRDQGHKQNLDRSFNLQQTTYQSDYKNYATGRGLFSADGDFEVWKRVVIEGYSKSRDCFYGLWLKDNTRAVLRSDQVRFDDH